MGLLSRIFRIPVTTKVWANMLRDFKAPNVKGPRYRPPSLNLLKKDFYELTRKSNVLLKGLTNQQIKAIIQTANGIMQQAVLERRDGVELPEQLGYLFLGAVPATKDRNVDYKRSIELKKLVHHQNWETDNLSCKLFYTNYAARYRFKFHELWQFTPVRQFKKAASKAFLADYTKYVKTDNLLKVSRLYRKLLRCGKQQQDL